MGSCVNPLEQEWWALLIQYFDNVIILKEPLEIKLLGCILESGRFGIAGGQRKATGDFKGGEFHA